MSIPVSASLEPWCETCDDTGWAIVEAPHPQAGQPPYTADATHTRAEPCHCRPMNPTYQRKRDRLREAREAHRGR